jgi:hypothetical protein
MFSGFQKIKTSEWMIYQDGAPFQGKNKPVRKMSLILKRNEIASGKQYEI